MFYNVDKNDKPITPLPPCDHDWKVRGVDSYCAKCGKECIHQASLPNLPWGNASSYGDGVGGLNLIRFGDDSYLECKTCRRKFQMTHPVIMESVVRSLQRDIDELQRQVDGV